MTMVRQAGNPSAPTLKIRPLRDVGPFFGPSESDLPDPMQLMNFSKSRRDATKPQSINHMKDVTPELDAATNLNACPVSKNVRPSHALQTRTIVGAQRPFSNSQIFKLLFLLPRIF